MGFKHVSSLCVDFIWPPHSLLSGKPVCAEDLGLWNDIVFLDTPACARCGFPFEFNPGTETLCGACSASPPKFDRARAAIAYDETSRKMVLDFKHGGYTDGLDFFATQLGRVGRDILESADFLIPVPLHPKRLRQRRFNQSALLARALSRQCGLPYLTQGLKRIKNTPSQGAFTGLGRARNVRGAFQINPAKTALIKGAHMVLIDDVYTTGATLNACARTLRKAGAAQIDVLTLMRVVRPSTMAK